MKREVSAEEQYRCSDRVVTLLEEYSFCQAALEDGAEDTGYATLDAANTCEISNPGKAM